MWSVSMLPSVPAKSPSNGSRPCSCSFWRSNESWQMSWRLVCHGWWVTCWFWLAGYLRWLFFLTPYFGGWKKISFGGIPNSSSIILMPRFTTWAPFFLRSGSAHVDDVIAKRCSKQSHGCPGQGCKATNHTVTLRNLPNPASGTYTSAHRNSPEPASGTYSSTHQNSPEPSRSWLRNLQ